MYAIFGATGNTGRAAADALLAAGEAVRVVVRRPEAGEEWAERGAEVAVADLDDAAALRAALTGARGVYALAPPDWRTEDHVGGARRRAEAVAAAARATGVGHVVFLSSVGAQHATGTGVVEAAHAAEAVLRASGLGVTLLRAAYFQENWAAVLATVAEHGVLPSFIPADLRLDMVATVDIGRAAAAALVEPPSAGEVRVVAVKGPAALTPREVAAALSERLAREVAVQEAPLDAIAPMFASFGASAHFADKYAELFVGIRAGRLDWEGTERDHIGRQSAGDTLGALLGAS